MKTYWLLGREPVENANARCPFGSILLEEISKVKSNDEVFTAKVKNVNEQEYSELRSLYSPVSFEDVKRTKSANTTPHNSPAKKLNLFPDHYSNAGEGRGRVNNNHDTCNNKHEIEHLNDVVLIKNKIQHEDTDTNKIHYSPSDCNHPSKSCQIL